MEEKVENGIRFDSIDPQDTGQNKMQKLIKYILKFPRIYYLSVYVVFPLFFLIAICFICGYFLTLLEKEAEVIANDSYLRKIFIDDVREGGFQHNIIKGVQTATSVCINKYTNYTSISINSTTFSYNDTEIDDFMRECMGSAAFAQTLIDDPKQSLLGHTAEVPDSLSFHWMRCPLEDDRRKGLTQMQYSAQSVLDSFNASFMKREEEFERQIREKGPSKKAMDAFIGEIGKISGHEHCHLHTAGGALFWFTVMTTIGYGNTVPQSDAGRALIYTLGFISILLFAAVNAKAGYVSLAIADDFFRHHHLVPLSTGMGACIFWLCAYFLWNTVLAGMVIIWANLRSSPESSMKHMQNAYWFAFITTTTVGFGDYHLPHEITYGVDMIYTPFVTLLGFVFLANFLIKFGDWIGYALVKYNLVLNMHDLHELLEKQSQLEREASQKRIENRRKRASSRNISS